MKKPFPVSALCAGTCPAALSLVLTALSLYLCGCVAHPYKKGLAGINVKNSTIYVETLASDNFEGRKAGSHGSVAAAEQIVLWLADIGVEPLFGESYFQTFDPAQSPELTTFQSELFKNIPENYKPMIQEHLSGLYDGIDTLRNVLGKIQGRNPDEYVIVGAHYDHLGIDPKPLVVDGDDKIFNGADDNASGVAGVLQIARAFAASGERPQRTIIFALWDAEESALTGSGYFSQTFEDIEKVRAYYNLDMIGRDEQGEKGDVYYLSTDSTQDILLTAEVDVRACGLGVRPVIVPFTPDGQAIGGSDHQSFHLKGIPVYYVSAGDHPDVHSPSDEADKTNFQKMTDIAKMAYLTVYRLANPDAKIVHPAGKKSATDDDTAAIIDTGDAPIFDYNADYPACTLTLADIADVEFIPIGKSEDFLMSGSSNYKGGETYVSDNFILKQDNNQLFMFDRQGNPIRKIGEVGRGPGEYEYLLHFVGVDETLGEVYIYGGDRKVQVYGLDGVFRRTIETETRNYLAAMSLLNDKEIVCLDNRGVGFFTISRENGKKVRNLPVPLPLPYAHDSDGRMVYPNILHNGNGTTLFELRSDVIWRISPSGELLPVMVDVTKYPSPDELYGPDNAQFLPLFETDKYIIGSVLCSPWITPDVKDKQYIYDKEQKQWFSLGKGNDWSGYETISDIIRTVRTAKPLSPGYAVWYLQPARLLENRDKWQSAELEKILEGVAEDDNPVLMLVKFK